MAEQFDLIVIGGGPAGYTGAIRAAQLGFKTAVIERREPKTMGGTCLNVGCIPSKALLESSEKFHEAKHKFAKHGITVGDLKFDLSAMMKRKDAVVRQLTNGIGGLFKKHGIEGVFGHAKIVAGGVERKVEVTSESGTRTLTAPRILICTGSEPTELPFLKFDGKQIISSTEALTLTEVPKHLVVIGGGVIGLELGSVWNRLGAKVTVIEFNDKLLATMDQHAAQALQKAMTAQGMEFRFSTKCLGAKPAGNIMVVETENVTDGTKFALECDVVLVCVGRKPYTANLGLESVGIKTDKAGRIEIDEHFQTAAPGVYAVGDVIIGPMLAHKAEEEAVAAVEIMAGQAGHVNYDAIPSVIYTWPEVATVGATEQELQAKGIEYKTGSFPFMANGRAKAMEDTEGLVKIIADAKTDRVLGVHICGPRAGEMIHEAVAVMEFGGSAEDMARTCHAHPTLNEAVKEAALAVDKRVRNM